MKPLLLTLALFTGLAAFAPQAQAGDRKVTVVNNYYNVPAQQYRGGNRGSCQNNGGYYSAQNYGQPVYYRQAYVQPAPVRYYDSGCRQRPVQNCRTQPRGSVLSFVFGF